MAPMSNNPVDLTSWPELDEVDVVPVRPSYAKARALVWGTVTLGIGLALLDRLWRFPFGATKRLQCGSGDFGGLWVTSMGLWGLEEWKGWPLRGYLRGAGRVYRSGWWS